MRDNPTIPNELFGSWLHSFEEDSGDITVYRPADYAFPPARGRAGVEFRPDGAFVELAIGRGDAHQATIARWQAEPSGRVRIVYPGNARAPITLEIVQVDENVLRLRKGVMA